MENKDPTSEKKWSSSFNCDTNQSFVTDFILQSFSVSRKIEFFLFVFFLILYLFMIVGNGLIIRIVCIDQRLQRPMYFFLANFSGSEICYTTVFIPKMLTNLFTNIQSISRTGCFVQLYFYAYFGVVALFLLTVMAFDRYQAICNPLHYTIIMNTKLCIGLALACWIGGVMFNIPPLLLISQDFCCENIIRHFLCDGPTMTTLACSDTRLSDLVAFIFSLLAMLGSFLCTFFSYFWVVYTILKMASNTGRTKAFSTCSSHLTAATMYYGSLIFTYARPQSVNGFAMNKAASMCYTIVIPVLNPLIYSLRNRDVKDAITKIIRVNKHFS